MKRLAVLRHAKSRPADPGTDDFDRPLNDRGRAAARLVGSELERRGAHFGVVLASPAARVRETVAGVGETYRFGGEIRFEPRIYEAGARTLAELVRGLPDAVESALLVGHNPGVQELVLDLSGGDDRGLRDRMRYGFPTAALAMVQFPAQRWADVQSGAGEVVELILPSDGAD